jgi:hypothetical protein
MEDLSAGARLGLAIRDKLQNTKNLYVILGILIFLIANLNKMLLMNIVFTLKTIAAISYAVKMLL